jgi:hypothetical protein
MTVTETRVQVKRFNTTKYVGISGAKVVASAPPDDLVITIPDTFKLNKGDTVRTVFVVVEP